MSTTDLYIINGKSVSHVAQYRNGWGSGPVAWDYLSDKYIAEKPIYSLHGDHMKKVWALQSDDRLEECERLALLMTFDGAFVPVHALGLAGDLCIEFAKLSEDGERENHWRVIGEDLKKLSRQKLNRHARGAALSCTSVCDPWADAPESSLSNAWPIFEEDRPDA